MIQYSDILKKQRARTWPYGTQKKVKVIHVEAGVMICVDAAKEGYVLLGTDSDESKIDETGVITFTQGGPLGGYWKFTRSAP